VGEGEEWLSRARGRRDLGVSIHGNRISVQKEEKIERKKESVWW
jgi:hypothetical protein